MSRAYACGDREETKNMLVTSIKAVTVIILPIMAVMLILSKPIIAVLFQHGGFTYSDTLHTSGALSCYAFGMIALAYNEILSKAFFSMQNSKTPMVNAIFSMLANIGTAYILSAKMGIAGLAVAAAVGSYVNAILNYIFIKKYYETLLTAKDFLGILKTLFCAACMSGVMAVIYRFAPLKDVTTLKNAVFILVLAATVGFLVYFGLILLAKIDIISNLFKRRAEKNE